MAEGEGAPRPVPADKSPKSVGDRIAFIDVLRALAVCRIVLNHALPWGWIQWFPAIPILFFFSGVLMGRSMQSRDWKPVFLSRVNRLALPLGTYLVFVLVVEAAGVLGGLTVHLWYVWTFLVFAALSGAFQWLIRRAPWVTTSALLAVVLGFGVASAVVLDSQQVLSDQLQALSAGAAYAFFWVGGMFWADRGFDVPRRGRLAVLAMVGTIAGVAAVWVFHDGIDATATANLYGISLVGVGVAVLAVGAMFRHELELLLKVNGLGGFIHFLNRRLLTIYLWHVPAAAVATKLTSRLDLAGGLAALSIITITIALTGILAVALGGLEDRALMSSRKGRPNSVDLPSTNRPDG